jgi:hypothetical protein
MKGEPLERIVSVRFTATEYDALALAAELVGVGPSTLVRMRALGLGLSPVARTQSPTETDPEPLGGFHEARPEASPVTSEDPVVAKPPWVFRAKYARDLMR